MPGSTDTLLGEGTRVLREIAVQQGLAYRTYGEALERFGEAKIGWPELMKTSGDLYAKEAVRTIWSLIRADTNIFSWMLSLAGAKPVRPSGEPTQGAAPSGKRAQRGRD